MKDALKYSMIPAIGAILFILVMKGLFRSFETGELCAITAVTVAAAGSIYRLMEVRIMSTLAREKAELEAVREELSKKKAQLEGREQNEYLHAREFVKPLAPPERSAR